MHQLFGQEVGTYKNTALLIISIVQPKHPSELGENFLQFIYRDPGCPSAAIFLWLEMAMMVFRSSTLVAILSVLPAGHMNPLPPLQSSVRYNVVMVMSDSFVSIHFCL